MGVDYSIVVGFGLRFGIVLFSLDLVCLECFFSFLGYIVYFRFIMDRKKLC